MPPTTVALAVPPPPGLAEATKNSTTAWQQHLDDLFRRAKDRFPDVVWELTAEDDEDKVLEEVWGHKAIVYARAPPTFQSRYFSFRPNPITSPTPYSHSPTGGPSQSALSLGLPSGISRSPSPFRTASPSTLNPNTSLLRISTSINPTLFSNELEYLYTGQGFGEAFEFLFDSADSRDLTQDGDAEDLRIDKLRKDLVFMWRSRLYSDVRLALSGNFSSITHESTTAIFSSHRFILVSRCPYFHDALVSWPTPKSTNPELPTLTLPSPPFTPASLHFTLGYIYTGTLVFSHRTYDLSTAFAILRAALYLSLTTLQDEVQARIAHEMLHGLFHAFLPFQEYERLTASKWGTGGCRCRQCARRVPRVLEFALEDDVKNTHLERGARRALVGLYGEGWCTQEFATLSPKLRESLLKGVSKRTTPQNVFPLLFSAEHALIKLASNIDSWVDTVRDMILAGRKVIDEVICKESEATFSSEEWMEIMESDGSRFGDLERVEWAMAAALRGVKEAWAATLYQTLVSSVLLKPHPSEPNSPFLSSTSQIRQQVEQARVELLKWMSKRWLQIRHEHGFDSLEGWTIKEISDYIEVSIDDLLSPTPPTNTRNLPHNKAPNTHLRPISNHPHTSRTDADSETAGSMRVSVLSRNLNSRRGTASVKDNASVHSSITSIRSARSSVSTSSAASDSTIGRSSRAETMNTGMSPARRIVQDTRAREAARVASTATKDRPDSKLTPASPDISPTSQPSIHLPLDEVNEDDAKSIVTEGGGQDDEDDGASAANSEAATEPDSTPVKKTVITRASLASVSSRVSTTPRASARNKSSVASTHSTTRKPTVSVTSRTSVAKSTTTSSSRPVSRGSTRTSTASTLSRTSTARSTLTMSSRPTSSVSTASTASAANHRSSTVTTESAGSYRTASSGLSTPQPRSRKSSAASAASVRTAGPSPSSPIPPRVRKTSSASVSSVNSTASSSAYGTAKTSVSKAVPPPVPPIDPTKLSPAAAKTKSNSVRSVRSTSSIKKAAAAGKGLSPSQKSLPPSSAPVSPIDIKSTVPLPDKERSNDEVDNTSEEVQNTSSTITIKPRKLSEELENTSSTITIKPRMLSKSDTNDLNQNEHKKTDSTTSTGSNATIRRRKSNETIAGDVTSPTSPLRTSSGSSDKPRLLDKPQPPLPVETDQSSVSFPDGAPRGATLEIGIPCIVSSKRKRFKAYARYIGEVEGEYGPWVGVEVPIPLGESWTDRDIDSGWQGTQWNDGTWGGIRYFEIGNRGSDWDYSYDDRATRRRRVDGGGLALTWSKDKTGLKREGDQLLGMERVKRMRSVSPAISDSSGAESRGLFVRPQQVLYVVDAVEDL